MLRIRFDLKPEDLEKKISRLFELSAIKIRSIEQSWTPKLGSPVFTVNGRYTSASWTEWTQGFQFGSAVLHFDATEDREFLNIGYSRTLELMAPHVSHFGVHDHGFNNISTYGNTLRLMDEGRIADQTERRLCELALKCSGAVQAFRWARIAGGRRLHLLFQWPHLLFIDTMRSLRSLAVAHRLGHVLLGEADRKISLLDRLIFHIDATARYNVYYGDNRDIWDIRGRVAQESIFNTNDGQYRCPGTQQGYSPFSTWTRGLAWAICGFAEQLEFVDSVADEDLAPHGGREAVLHVIRRAAEAASEYYIDSGPTDGIPYWDTAAPGLNKLPGWAGRPAHPFNSYEPVDSSAAAIAAQGLLRLGKPLRNDRYWQAGLTICHTLLDEPWLSVKPDHQGLLLHSVYHRPKGWDFSPENNGVTHGESSMWGDYHIREVSLYLLRIIRHGQYLRFWSDNRTIERIRATVSPVRLLRN